MIADYLLHDRETVFHVLGKDHIVPARVNGSRETGPKRTLVYSANE